MGKKSIRKEERRRALEYSAVLMKAKGEFPSKEIHERSPAWGINGLALVPLHAQSASGSTPEGAWSVWVTWLI